MNIDPRNTIAQALAALCATPTSVAARAFFASLGYSGTRTFPLSGLDDFLETFDPDGELRARRKAFLNEWRSIDLLFQLTDDDLTGEGNLFTETRVDKGLMRSYLFFHIVLKNDTYPRSKLAQITRQINRLFTMPIMVLFSCGSTLSIAVINRRRNKIDASKDVLGKVTLIHGIRCADPHRGHLDILASFSIPELSRIGDVSNFDTLHAALEKIFNLQLLNDLFYKRIQKWFFWAVQEITFPHGGIADPDQRNRIAAIRLLTRVIFCWFAREKRLVPTSLFTAATARKVLKNFDPLSRSDGTYYTAILQNLFFPTLSVPLEQREFRNGRRFKGVNKHYMNHAYFRHEAAFKEPGDIPRLFEKIPFLNGGLFACLDYLDKEGTQEVRVDGFSDTAAKQPIVPNLLFFGKEVPVDISAATGNPTDTAVKIDGLFTILDAFKFTVTENTPVEEEIALDPELLGRIFENLLAEYNPETQKTARKQTGSFYTPRAIVDYMVNESLKAYLHSAICRKIPAVTPADASEGLDILFSYTEREHAFTAAEKRVLVDAIYDAAILDPACGSGAFPMGMLQKLVYVLDKLDHGHDHWKQRILADTPPAMKEQTGKWLATASADFTWKLGLVQRSIYGIDIQPFAVQIAKLRCFVSLLVDFDVDPAADNYGVPSLPNLDFKFVAANTLIKPPSEAARDDDPLKLEDPFFSAFAALAEDYFFVRDPVKKKDLQEKIEALIEQQIDIHRRRILAAHKNTKTKFLEEDKSRLALWESYRNIFAFRNGHVGFFDPRYFFPEIKDGFDIVIGNPPYVRHESITDQKPVLKAQSFTSFNGMADLFVYFYERGIQLLAPNGYLCFITSNKYLRAGYGKEIREYLAAKTSISNLIDFGDSPVFEAIAYPSIILTQSAEPEKSHKLNAFTWTPGPDIAEFPAIFLQNQFKVLQSSLRPEGWQLERKDVLALLNKLRAVGKPLGEFVNGRVYYGIKTGLNEAFVVDRATRDRLISEHKSSEEILKPFLRGRDLRRWHVDSRDKWLCYIGWKTDITKYPAINEHITRFEKLLKARPEVKGGRVPWYALSRYASDYSHEYAETKIFWPGISLEISAFCLDKKGYWGNDNTQMIITKDRSVLGILNSSISRFFLKNICDAVQNDYLRLKVNYVTQIPIPQATPAQQTAIVAIVDRILDARATNPAANVSSCEAEIDRLVYDLYGLTTPEIAIIEGKQSDGELS